MQTQNKSIKKQLVFSLILFALLAVITAISILIAVDRIYRNIISIEIQSTTKILSQSIDKFLDIPDDYLRGIKEQIDGNYSAAGDEETNFLIKDIVNFTGTFESINLLDDSGIVLNTWPLNRNYIGIDMSNHKYFKNTVEPGVIYWSDTFLSTETGHPTVALTTKCSTGIIVAFYNLNQLGDFISVELPDEKDFIAVIDSNGNVIAHTHKDHSILTCNLNNMKSIRASLDGSYGISEDYYMGNRGLASIMPAKNNGLIILVFKSYDRIFQNLFRIYSIFLVIIALISFFFLLLILLFVKRFLKPMNDLQKTFHTVSTGRYDMIPLSRFSEFKDLTNSVISMVERIKKREEDLRTAVDERETLLSELNHRTKNNMQLIAGIMALYSMKNPGSDPQGILEKIQSKIKAISLVHDNLYRSSDLSSINLKTYVEEIIPSLIDSFADPSKRIKYRIEVEDLYLSIDYAVPCGLIINELIINSLKYAFPSADTGEIRVSSRKTGANNIEISYSDDGIGLPASSDFSSNETLGFTIVNSIVTTQLKGNLMILPDDGFSCKFSFSLNTYDDRITSRE